MGEGQKELECNRWTVGGFTGAVRICSARLWSVIVRLWRRKIIPLMKAFSFSVIGRGVRLLPCVVSSISYDRLGKINELIWTSQPYFFFYSSWRGVKLHLLDVPSDKSRVLLVPFLLLEVWFRGGLLLLHFYTEYIKTGDRTVGRVDLHTRRLDLQHLLACFCLTLQVQWPNTPLLAEA